MRLRVKLGNLISLADSFNGDSNIINQLRIVYTEKYSTNVCPFINQIGEWETLHSLWISLNNSKNISHLFLYNLKYYYDIYVGTKPSSFEKYLETFEPRAILISTIKYIANNIGDMYFDKWNKIWNALTANYNPISNYNMNELEEYNTNKKTKTNTDIKSKINTDLTEKTNVDLKEKTNTNVKVSTNVDTTEKTNTDVKVSTNIDTKEKTNTDITTKHKVDQTDNTDESVYGFNSVTAVPKSGVVKHITGLPDNNYDETKGIADNNYINKTGLAQDNYQRTVGSENDNYINKTGLAQDNYQQTVGNENDNYINKVGSENDNYTKKVGNAETNFTNTVGDANDNYIEEIGDAEDNYRHLNKEGNIGIRSNQELLEQELELRKHKFYDIMFMDINLILLNNVYY